MYSGHNHSPTWRPSGSFAAACAATHRMYHCSPSRAVTNPDSPEIAPEVDAVLRGRPLLVQRVPVADRVRLVNLLGEPPVLGCHVLGPQPLADLAPERIIRRRLRRDAQDVPLLAVARGHEPGFARDRAGSRCRPPRSAAAGTARSSRGSSPSRKSAW